MKFESTKELLNRIGELVEDGLNAKSMAELFELLGLPQVPMDFFTANKVHTEFAPLIKDFPYDETKRCLHIAWDVINKSVYSEIESFAIPYRQMIAKKLFKRCGKNFSALNNVSFFFPENIEVGDNVLFHKNCFIDGGGGVVFGDNAGLSENCIVFTHEHDEGNPMIEYHKPVVFEEGAMVFSNVTIMYGVTLGANCIVGANSLVNKDVPANTLVAGSPARILRERRQTLNDEYEYGFFKDVTE